ncbi:MAG TPA: hypothetical protein VEK07_21805 [Polyangiaceae bacterium]|nr:hypothetical protein [Polyangiaceae bacterium]
MAGRFGPNALAALSLTLTAALGAASACGGTNGDSVFQKLGGADASAGGDGAVTISSSSGLLAGDSGVGGMLQGVPSALYFQPPSASIVVGGTTPVTAQFTLMAVGADGGSPVAVNPDSFAFDRPDLGTPSGGLPIVITAPSNSPPYAGTGTIHAIFQGVEATASLTVQVHVVEYGPGLTAQSPAVLALSGDGATDAQAADAGGTTAGQLPADPAPNISPPLYPYDGTVWPLGLTSPLVMWNAPQTGDVYWLHYAEQNYTVDAYYTLASLPAQLRLDQTDWDRLTASNNAANAPDPLTFVVSRWDQTTGAAYTTATETWTVAPQSLSGAIYYWTASQQSAQAARVGHISKFQPGTGATPQPLNNGICMGCHAVNAQGTILVADVDDGLENERSAGTLPPDAGVPSVAPYGNWSGTRAWASFDITQPSSPLLYQSNKFGADVALTPDGKYLVFGGPTNQPGSKYISLGDPLTGQVIATSGLDEVTLDPNETNLEMPAFSPDGTMLAVVQSDNAGDTDNVLPGQPEVISYLEFNEAGDAGGPAFEPVLHDIVAGSSPAFATTGGGLGYPSFTPDSKAVAFHAGTWSTGCATGCLDPDVDDGDLFIATIDGGAPIRLAAADDPPDPNDGFSSVEPTFNPVVRGGYSWVVFTSMRNWGNQPWPDDGSIPPDAGPDMHVNGKRRLWVAAVDTNLGATDPSHPAIYLEGQEDTPNMRGFWTLASCIATPGGSGASGGADSGADDDASSADGGAQCTDGFQCCSGFCEQGVCVDVNTISCVGLGASCASASDCCNPAIVSCLGGTCSVPTIPR